MQRAGHFLGLMYLHSLLRSLSLAHHICAYLFITFNADNLANSELHLHLEPSSSLRSNPLWCRTYSPG